MKMRPPLDAEGYKPRERARFYGFLWLMVAAGAGWIANELLDDAWPPLRLGAVVASAMFAATLLTNYLQDRRIDRLALGVNLLFTGAAFLLACGASQLYRLRHELGSTWITVLGCGMLLIAALMVAAGVRTLAKRRAARLAERGIRDGIGFG